MFFLFQTIVFFLLGGSIASAASCTALESYESPQWSVALFSALVGGLVTGGGIEVFRWLFRPRLFIDFEDKNEGIADISWSETNKDQTKRVYDRRFVMLRVNNKGSRATENCRIYLIGIEIVKGKTVGPTKYANSLQLSWPGWNFDARPVYRDVPVYVDLVSIDKAVPEWRIQVQGLAQAQSELKDHRTLRFHVVAVADNAAPYFAMADVFFSGDPKSLKVLNVLPEKKKTWLPI